MGVRLSEDIFGEIKDKTGTQKPVKRFTWTNSNKVSVQVINYGGYITSIKVPDTEGNIDDIVLGFDNIEGYLRPDNRYKGATIGRVANRTANAKMTVEGLEYHLAANNGPNHLHGGVVGFDKVFWESYVSGSRLVLSYHSTDMEEGYPGDLIAQVIFELTEDNEFRIEYKAVATKPTPVNMTNHSYFNLAGSGAGAKQLYNHLVCINADRFTEVRDGGIPTGNLPSVANTVFDLRIPRRLGDVIHKVPDAPGFDHNFCISRGSEQGNVFVSSVYHPGSGRVMEVYSNQSGVQFYTANFQPEDDSLPGKGGAFIRKHGGFCLETQNYPDAVNQSNFPNVILYPGQQYHHTTAFKFITDCRD